MVTIPKSSSEIEFSDFLKMHFFKDAENGAPIATSLAQAALFVASRSLLKTRLCSKYDQSGIKVTILYHYCAALLFYTNRWSRLRFFRRRCGAMVNSTANVVCSLLGIFFVKFYEESLDSIGFALSMAILFLILVAIIQPRTDLGFCGFQIGATASVAYNRFQLKVGFWIVVAICFVLFGFKSWLDKNWLDTEMTELDNKFVLPILVRARIKDSRGYPYGPLILLKMAEPIAIFTYGFFAYPLLLGHCVNSESWSSCSAMEKLKCVAIYILCWFPACIHHAYSLGQVQIWGQKSGYSIIRSDLRGPSLQKELARGLLWKPPGNPNSSVLFRLSHGGEVSLDGNCLFTASQRAMACDIDARELRRRTVERFLEDLGSASQEEREVIADAIRHMYSPDLRSRKRIRSFQLVKLLAKKDDRIALDSAIDELVQQGMHRKKAAESIYKERCIPVNDGPSWAKYMSISGSPDDDEYDVITLCYDWDHLFTVDENREGHAAAFGDDIAIECLATELKREIYVLQAHESDGLLRGVNSVSFLLFRPRSEIVGPPFFLFVKERGLCGAGSGDYGAWLAYLFSSQVIRLPCAGAGYFEPLIAHPSSLINVL